MGLTLGKPHYIVLVFLILPRPDESMAILPMASYSRTYGSLESLPEPKALGSGGPPSTLSHSHYLVEQSLCCFTLFPPPSL